MADDEIDIAFGADSAFIPHVAATIASLTRHAPGARFRFIILHDGVPEALCARLESTAPGARFCWVQIRDDDIPQFASRKHFSRAILLRLGLPALAPADCKRVLYLDADLILLRDVRQLWRADLAGAPIGAIVDSYLDPAKFAQAQHLPWPSTGYFNSGVLLMDLEQVRASNMLQTAIEFAARHGHVSQFPDQDALNIAAWGRWRPLPPMWNAQYDMIVPWLAPNLPPHLQFHKTLPAIVHFTGPGKPWTLGFYHPWSWIYWDNLARTPFAAEVAAASGIDSYQRMRLWLRWIRRRPMRRAPSTDAIAELVSKKTVSA
jgi:lipopolysaccharide biosynthesis glycosyltransferase